MIDVRTDIPPRDWFTNGYLDPERYADRLRRRLTVLRRCYRLSSAEGGRPHYTVQYVDILAVKHELQSMRAL